MPAPRPACPTGRVVLTDLRVTLADGRLKATGYLVNRTNGEILAASYEPPMVHGLNDQGKWVTIISDGSLTPDWANGTVSPNDFVIKPGARARFAVDGPDYRASEVVRWYPIPAGLHWNEWDFDGRCGIPSGSDYTSPAYAG